MKITLFDIDDTLLVCPKGSNALSSQVMFKKVFNLDADEDLIYTKGKPDAQIISEVIRKLKNLPEDEEVDVPDRAHQAWAEALEEILNQSHSIILPGVIDLLENLYKDKNILLGVLTGNSYERGEVKLKASSLNKYFKEKIYGGDLKKRSDLIERANDKLGKNNYILVDDSLVGAKMAKENNIPIILVATGGVSEDELREYSDYVFKDFGEGRYKEVVEIIKSL